VLNFVSYTSRKENKSTEENIWTEERRLEEAAEN
jgi:hypothetical protein